MDDNLSLDNVRTWTGGAAANPPPVPGDLPPPVAVTSPAASNNGSYLLQQAASLPGTNSLSQASLESMFSASARPQLTDAQKKVLGSVKGRQFASVDEKFKFLQDFERYLSEDVKKKDPFQSGNLLRMLEGAKTNKSVHVAQWQALSKEMNAFSSQQMAGAPPEPDTKKVVQKFRGMIRNFDGNEKPLAALLHNFFSGIAPEKRVTHLNAFRLEINKTPSYIPNSVRNQVHDMLDSFGTQVLPDGAEVYGPSLSSNEKQQAMSPRQAIHRGPMEIVKIGDVHYTPVYMAIRNSHIDGPAGSVPTRKDFEQDANGQILVHGGGKGEDAEIFISIGQSSRQLRYLEKYQVMAKKQVMPLIRSFLIPLDVANQLQEDLVTENSIGTGFVKNVDKHNGANQLGVSDPDMLHLLRANALKGSLITYGNKEFIRRAGGNWGEAVDVSRLKKKYGYPMYGLKGLKLVADANGFIGGPENDKLIARLVGVLDTRDKMVGQQPIDPQASAGFYDFVREHCEQAQGNSDAEVRTLLVNAKLQSFFETVADWATQCQIVKAQYQDYNCMVDSYELPREPELVRFPTPVAEPALGRVLLGHLPLSAAENTLISQAQTLDQSARQLWTRFNAVSQSMHPKFWPKDDKVSFKKQFTDRYKPLNTVLESHDFLVRRVSFLETLKFEELQKEIQSLNAFLTGVEARVSLASNRQGAVV